MGGQVLQGKELSYNNLLDLDAAWKAAVSFEKPSIAIVKYLSPCGIASAQEFAEAFRAALASDPVSAFGGVMASNREFDDATADALGDLFRAAESGGLRANCGRTRGGALKRRGNGL